MYNTGTSLYTGAIIAHKQVHKYKQGVRNIQMSVEKT